MDSLLRILTLCAFAGWQMYWWITAKKADREKPKVLSPSKLSYFKRYVLHIFVYSVVIGQLLGLDLMQFHFNSQPVGFFLVLVGVAISVSARKTLGTNWAHAAEYQIKQKQVLVTQGIYAYIRNPIYTGLVISLIGAELVAQSYLFLFFFLGFLVAYKQSKLEEKILEKHFGKAYVDYKKRSKMLIPFVF